MYKRQPLLQWLQVGAATDGYLPGCFAAHPQATEAFCQAAHADDLALVSSTIRGTARMLRKVELYSDWAKIYVNVGKCAVTGRERGAGSRASLKARLADAVRLAGAPVPFLRACQAYKYLGVKLSLDLNPSHHSQYLLAAVRDRLRLISRAPPQVGIGNGD